MCFIEREHQNFILKFREIFLWRETVLRAHRMKSDEKPFFCQIYGIVWGKMVLVVIDRHFSLFLKGLMIFLKKAITDSTFKNTLASLHLNKTWKNFVLLFSLKNKTKQINTLNQIGTFHNTV